MAEIGAHGWLPYVSLFDCVPKYVTIMDVKFLSHASMRFDNLMQLLITKSKGS